MAKEIELVKGLPLTAGWNALSETDKAWMQEHTSIVRGLRRDTEELAAQAGSKAIATCLETAGIRQFLEGKSMPFTRWAENCFPGAFDVLQVYAKLRDRANGNDEALRYLAKHGVPGLSNIQGGDIANALVKAPPPKNPSQFPAWSKQLEAEVRTERSQRRRNTKKRKLSDDDFIRIFVTTNKRLLKETGIPDSAGRRALLKKALSYLMQTMAIAGTIAAEKESIPDGFMPKVGRPQKQVKAA
jgi:hypothetical protein